MVIWRNRLNLHNSLARTHFPKPVIKLLIFTAEYLSAESRSFRPSARPWSILRIRVDVYDSGQAVGWTAIRKSGAETVPSSWVTFCLRLGHTKMLKFVLPNLTPGPITPLMMVVGKVMGRRGHPGGTLFGQAREESRLRRWTSRSRKWRRVQDSLLPIRHSGSCPNYTKTSHTEKHPARTWKS